MRFAWMVAMTLALAGAATGQQTALTLGGTPVSAADYGRTLRLLGAPPPRTLAPADRRAEAERYLNFESLVAAAKAQGLEATPEFQHRVAAREQQILVQMLYERLRRQANTAAPAEVADYYQKHAGDFVELHLLRLFVPFGEGTADAAGALAAKLRTQAAKGDSFEKLQRELDKKLGGEASDAIDIGWHQPGTLALTAADDAQVFALEPGETSAVLTEATGRFIFQAVARRQVAQAVADQEIRQALFRRHLQGALARIRQGLKVQLNDAYFDAPAAPGRRAAAPPR